MDEPATLTVSDVHELATTGGEQVRQTDARRAKAARAVSTLGPPTIVLVVAAGSLARNGVALEAMAKFTVYWIFGLLVAGTLVFRALVGRRDRLFDDLAFGAATGVTIEIVVWSLLRPLSSTTLVTWWAPAVLILFAVVPALRHHWSVERRTTPMGWANWAAAAVCIYSVVSIDRSGLRTTPLPPDGGSVYHDLWWHLGLVNEMLRDGAVQTPQISGEGLTYHYFVHVHTAMASQATGISTELVFLRLYAIPLAIVFVAVMCAVAHQITGVRWTGPLAAWLTLGAIVGESMWPGLGLVARTPLTIRSPSQLLANVLVIVGAGGVLMAAQRSLSRSGWVWLAAVLFVGSGSKPTVIFTLIAAVMVSAVASVVWDRSRLRPLAAVGALLVATFLWSIRSRGSSPGGRITLFGSLRSNDVYGTVVVDESIRGLNRGLLLDSLTSGTAALAALAAIAVIIGTHGVHFVGFITLAHHRTRNAIVPWFLAGGLSAALAAYLAIDQVGLGQVYFIHTAVGFGSLLTVWALATFTCEMERAALTAIWAVGLLVGGATALIARAILRGMSASDHFGILERAAWPFVTIASGYGIGIVLWKVLSLGRRRSGDVAALLIVVTIGTVAFSSLATMTTNFVEWIRIPPDNAISTDDVNYVSTPELEAAMWLRDNSGISDVVATNLHCRPADDEREFCDARGYWFGGLSGRRMVLDGWAYTGEAIALQGDAGRSYARQPSPWPERLELSQRAVDDPTPQVLDRLRSEYEARWLVAVHRAGTPSPRLTDLSELVFENEAVSIYRLP